MSATVKQILASEEKLNDVARAAFDSVNTNKTGEINYTELEAVMIQVSKDLGTKPPTSEDVSEVLNHLDTNKDGVISFNEFKVLIRDVLNAMVKQLDK